jgi:nucleotide-binding universal stress UspA family protein
MTVLETKAGTEKKAGPEKKVFVATDLSEAAGEAIRQADEWARSVGAELVACHVMPNPLRMNTLFPQLNEQMALDLPALRERAVDQLTEMVAEITGRASDDFAIVVDDGHPAAVIVEKAERYGADLIVVGNRGHSGVRQAALGSVATQVVRHAHCPVLIARPQSPTGVVLCATDFSDPAQPAVNAAVVEARRRGARLTLMHVVDISMATAGHMAMGFGGVVYSLPRDVHDTVERTVKAKLAQALVDAGTEGDTLVHEGSPAAAIVRAADELHAELVVVGTIGLTGLRRLTLGSVAEGVARAAPCPVLVVRQSEID